MRAGEIFIASIYNAIFGNPDLWKSTLMLVVYDENGGIYDHVPPPSCVADDTPASDTGIGAPFAFDRLGIRVPAILISPWIPKATVIPGPENPAAGRVFEHASIPATVAKYFLADDDNRSPRKRTRPRSSASFPIPCVRIRIVHSSMSTRSIQ